MINFLVCNRQVYRYNAKVKISSEYSQSFGPSYDQWGNRTLADRTNSKTGG